MIVCGCDVGSLTAKAVILKDHEIIASEVMRTTATPGEAAKDVIDKAISETPYALSDINKTVGTGYGREQITIADDVLSEIACHGKSAKWLMPNVKMVIDIGGQDAKAIKVNENGDIAQYVYNDVCATGTGRFLEVMAKALRVELEDMGRLSLEAKNPLKISSQCVVFAETEVISLVNEGHDVRDIIGGLHNALAKRVSSLARSIVVEEDVTMTGGGAKNIGVFKSLESALGIEIKKMEKIDPQVNGALGAALFASEMI